MPESMQVDLTDFSIIINTLNVAICKLSDGRQINPHCIGYGMVIIMTRKDGGPDENYYVLFNPNNPAIFKIEAFENKDNLKTGDLVYFYDDKAEAIVQSTLRGEGDTFTEIE